MGQRVNYRRLVLARDDDAVDETNLQRQIVHSTDRLGESKADSAKRTIEALNPDVTVKVFKERLTSENIDRILGEGWDVIVDGADNFPTRYLLNDASKELLTAYGGFPARTADQASGIEALQAQFKNTVDWQVAVDGIEHADKPNFEDPMPAYSESLTLVGSGGK